MVSACLGRSDYCLWVAKLLNKNKNGSYVISLLFLFNPCSFTDQFHIFQVTPDFSCCFK